MKKTIYTFLILLLASCAGQLDIDPTTSVDSAAAKKNLDLLVTGAYAMIGSGPGTTGPNFQEGALYSNDLLLNGDLLASENYMSWRGTFDQYKEIDNKLMSPVNTSVTRMWEKGYAAINLANVILKTAEALPQDQQASYRAHGLFIRGIIQFELLRFWMESSTNLGIPIITEPTEDFNEIKHLARATIDDCYTAIINDLTEAESLLSADVSIFANSYVAEAFLARVYLQKGDYASALAAANDVIENGGYSLVSSIADAFNTSGSPESIFEIQQTTQNNAGTSNDGLTTFYSCDNNTPGDAARGDVEIDQSFIDQYDVNDDRRTILIYQGDCSKASVTSAKWRNPYQNIPVIRLAEMYLIRAEANERLGSSVGDTPLNDINTIRERANAPLYGSVDLDAILLERELELAFEGQRIHDFRRTHKVITFNSETVDYTDPQFILPIPQAQINTNKNIEQNSYYK